MTCLIKAKGRLPVPKRKILKAPKAQLLPYFVTYRAPYPKRVVFNLLSWDSKGKRRMRTETDDWLTTEYTFAGGLINCIMKVNHWEELGSVRTVSI